MNLYEEKALNELKIWQRNMEKRPTLTSKLSKGMQNKMNSLIPEKAHVIITEAIKGTVKTVLFGSEFISGHLLDFAPLEEREGLVRDKIAFYKKTAALSGAGTGAGGFFLGLADFPILLSLKMKFLFDTSLLYGYDAREFKERMFILYIFQLAFCSDQRRLEIYNIMKDWNNYAGSLPENVDTFDWRTFQQEYRDYIDIAKMLQLVPVIGAAVGAYANYKLMNKLGDTAMNAFRLRLFK
ncbi:MAG: hypothetical protein K0R09_890 [Clostridiales bacterium]|jgi:hypothetical protein|nr:hypothetical protein [Clostridiales bacterium]